MGQRMGQCVQGCCSKDIRSEKKAKKKFVNSAQYRPEPKKLQSQSITTSNIYNTFQNESSYTHAYSMDTKTMKLLSHLTSPMENNTKHFTVPQMTTDESNNKSNESNLADLSNVPNVNIPDKSTSFELHELETNVTTSRVNKIADFSDMNDLKQIMKAQYSAAIEDNTSIIDTDNDSLFSDNINTKSEKDRRKSLPVNMISLYRAGTQTSWDEQKINTLSRDMQKQLRTLRRYGSEPKPNCNDNVDVSGKKHKTKNKSKNHTIVLDDMDRKVNDDLHQINSEARLFRHKSSAKWDVDAIDSIKGEMKEEMVNLMLMHQESGKKMNYLDIVDRTISNNDIGLR